MERYRSGRNELDSKSSCPQGHVGSNPTRSAKKPWKRNVSKAFSFVRAASILGKTIQMVPLVPRFLVPGSFHIMHTIQERCMLWCPNGARNC